MRFVTREQCRKGGIVTLVNLDGSLFPPADYISQFFADLVFSGVGGKVAVCAHRYSGEFGNLTSESIGWGNVMDISQKDTSNL